MKRENVIIEIKPQVKNDAGEWVSNKDYKLEFVGGDEIRKIKPRDGGEEFELVVYYFNIINADGSKQKGYYELPITNKKGELNYQIQRMISLELDVGDIIMLATDDKGYIDITKVGTSPVDEEEIDESLIAY